MNLSLCSTRLSHSVDLQLALDVKKIYCHIAITPPSAPNLQSVSCLDPIASRLSQISSPFSPSTDRFESRISPYAVDRFLCARPSVSQTTRYKERHCQWQLEPMVRLEDRMYIATSVLLGMSNSAGYVVGKTLLRKVIAKDLSFKPYYKLLSLNDESRRLENDTISLWARQDIA